MNIGIGCDHLGFPLKHRIHIYLLEQGYHIQDFGCHGTDPVDYPDIAFAVSEDIRQGRLSRGILVCGTGNGMAIAANKVTGIRAALCHDPVTAERARKNNDAQIMTMGALIIDWELARKVLDIWLATEFQGGPSARKVRKIECKEKGLDLVQDE